MQADERETALMIGVGRMIIIIYMNDLTGC